MVTRPDASIRIEWRLATLHHEVTRELQAATATCKRLLKFLPSHFVSLEHPPCANIELFVAYRLSLVNESREARSRYNAVALLLQQVTKTKGRSMWRLLRGRTALAYFHVLRRLELRLTARTAPPTESGAGSKQRNHVCLRGGETPWPSGRRTHLSQRVSDRSVRVDSEIHLPPPYPEGILSGGA